MSKANKICKQRWESLWNHNFETYCSRKHRLLGPKASDGSVAIFDNRFFASSVSCPRQLSACDRSLHIVDKRTLLNGRNLDITAAFLRVRTRDHNNAVPPSKTISYRGKQPSAEACLPIHLRVFLRQHHCAGQGKYRQRYGQMKKLHLYNNLYTSLVQTSGHLSAFV